MKAIYKEPIRIVDYGGEFIDIGGAHVEVEILDFVKSFWGTKAICRVENIFKEIPLDELQIGEPIDLEKVNAGIKQ